MKKAQDINITEELIESMWKTTDSIAELVEQNAEIDEDLIVDLMDSLWLKDMKLNEEQKMAIAKFATYMIMSDSLLEEIERDWTEEEKMFANMQEEMLRDEVWFKYFDKMPKKVQDKWNAMDEENM